MFNRLQTPQNTTTKAPPTSKIVQAKIPSSQKVELIKTPHKIGIVKLSKIVSKGAIFLDFRQQEVFE